jgi:hypothetical protein
MPPGFSKTLILAIALRLFCAVQINVRPRREREAGDGDWFLARRHSCAWMRRDRTPGKQKPAVAILDDQLSRGPVSGQHRLWGDGRAGVRDHGGGDRGRARQPGGSPAAAGRGMQAAGGADRILPCPQGRAYGFQFNDWTNSGDRPNCSPKAMHLTLRHPRVVTLRCRRPRA